MSVAKASIAETEPLEDVEDTSTVVSEPASEPANAHAETPGSSEAEKTDTGEAKRPREQRQPVSQAVVRMPLQLRSRHAQRVYRRSYETAQRALYTLSVMLRVYTNDAEAEQVGAVVDQMLASVRDDLTEEIARMEKVAETQGVNLEAVEYTQPQAFEAEVRTPKAGRYLGLVRQMDQFIALMDLLWLSGVYTDAQYNAGSYQWQRRMVKLANRLRNLSQRAMALARREDAPAGSLVKLLEGDGDSESDTAESKDADDDKESE